MYKCFCTGLFCAVVFSFMVCNYAVADTAEDYTMLTYKVQYDEIDEVKAILKKNPKAATYNNGEILDSAVGNLVNSQILKMLLDAGANPNYKQPMGGKNNLLHIAIDQCTSDPAVLKKVLAHVKLLVANGTDVNYKRESDGMTPLHVAAKNENVSKDVISALLEAKKLDINKRCNMINDSQGGDWPPLFFAVSRANDPTKSNKDIVQLLLKKKADIKMTTGQGELLINKNMTALHILAMTSSDRADIAEVLVSAGIPVDAFGQDLDGSNITPLCCASGANNPKICKFLLSKGADINVPDFEGVTIIGHARGYGTDKHYESAKVIIEWADAHPGLEKK
jgi:ankyrin repeat protein